MTVAVRAFLRMTFKQEMHHIFAIALTIIIGRATQPGSIQTVLQIADGDSDAEALFNMQFLFEHPLGRYCSSSCRPQCSGRIVSGCSYLATTLPRSDSFCAWSSICLRVDSINSFTPTGSSFFRCLLHMQSVARDSARMRLVLRISIVLDNTGQ